MLPSFLVWPAAKRQRCQLEAGRPAFRAVFQHRSHILMQVQLHCARQEVPDFLGVEAQGRRGHFIQVASHTPARQIQRRRIA